ncbi:MULTISPECIES: NADPH-dependent F420 reductase [unclassified Nocardia]|uniref:NADPH-dependent F420 reductase n=1 Tax=unclassified Nocardia TaxID=2637762 RepID=UPI001CE46B4C|nr:MULTISPECIES: NAD(P)-binding domain-containing protein [unclassified Nocardia]
MRIGIIGAGSMAAALGGGWAAAGHEIRIGARNAGAASELAANIGSGATGGSIAEAAAFGDAVLLALPPSAMDAVLRSVPGGFAGKTLIDCSNAFMPDEAAPEGTLAFVLAEDAVAERISATVPDAHVVKAFNLLAAEVFAADTREFEGRTLGMPYCGDDPAALRLVAGLIEDLKFQPIPAGGLHRARYLEATSVFVVGLWFGGQDARAMFPPVEATYAEVD